MIKLLSGKLFNQDYGKLMNGPRTWGYDGLDSLKKIIFNYKGWGGLQQQPS